ncbi:MAG TPA: hypothetical protein VM537_24190 [Anaerolineae bacterium]|nr:hypothetical protein [Anaerolineae bacterium]
MTSAFDLFCKVDWGGQLPFYTALAHRAALFSFNGHYEDMHGGRGVLSEDVDEINEGFFLPMPVVAFEDADSCVILEYASALLDRSDDLPQSLRELAVKMRSLKETKKAAHGEPRGINPEDPLMWTVVQKVPAPHNGGPIPGGMEGFIPGKTLLVADGAIFSVRKEEKLNSEGRAFWGAAIAVRGAVSSAGRKPMRYRQFTKERPPDDEALRHYMHQVVVSMSELMVAQRPGHWIVKHAPEKARKIKRRGPASSRPRPRVRYIVVTDKVCERIFRRPNPENAGQHLKQGHRRRRHWRTFRAERYRFKRGKSVLVPACWVGPKTGEMGGERYEICLDL